MTGDNMIAVHVNSSKLKKINLDPDWEVTEEEFKLRMDRYVEKLVTVKEIVKVASYTSSPRFFIRPFMKSNFCVVYGDPEKPDVVWRRTGEGAGTLNVVYVDGCRIYPQDYVGITAIHPCYSKEITLATEFVLETYPQVTVIPAGTYKLDMQLNRKNWKIQVQIGRDVTDLRWYDIVRDEILSEALTNTTRSIPNRLSI